jgi:hypothetical protein
MWIQKYLEFNKDSEAPLSFLTWTAVSTIAAVLQRKVFFEWGALRLYPNCYIVLVSEPGKARKGTALGPALSMLREIGIPMSAESTTRAQLVRALRMSNAANIDVNTGAGESHSSLTVFSPELTVFFGYREPQLIQDLADWFDCGDEWQNTTKTQGSDKIIGVYLNLIGATTPALIKTTLPAETIGGGLSSRIIYVYEMNRRFRNPLPTFPISKEGKALRVSMMRDLEQIHQLKGRFKAHEEYLKAYSDWYMTMPSDPPFDERLFGGYWSRRATHVIKLATIMSASRSLEMIVRLEDFELALTLLEETEKKMPYVFSGYGRAKHADIIEPIMNQIIRCGEIEFGVLLKHFIRDVSQAELESIVEAMTSTGFCTTVMKEGKRVIKHGK